ncbi:MAG: nitroreductase family protein [Spirochaetes bacterium]|nr:nitroreductase family protein [Spirochaetota bacterium]
MNENLVTIDHNACTRCGKCIQICPKDSLTIVNGKIVHLPDQCMLCSHCYAICPTDALSFHPHLLQRVCFSSFQVIEGENKVVGPQEFAAFVLSRRSIRKYREVPVSIELLKDLIAAAVCAPSGSNCQQWEFTVLAERKKVLELANSIRNFFVKLNAIVRNPLTRYLSVFFVGTALLRYYRNHFDSVEYGLDAAERGHDLLFHGAPALIIIHSDMDASLPLEDGQYAAYNIALMAHAMGLGTCFIGYATETINRSAKIKKSIGIPAKNRVLAVLTVGYPAIFFKRFALRKPYRMHIV